MRKLRLSEGRGKPETSLIGQVTRYKGGKHGILRKKKIKSRQRRLQKNIREIMTFG